MPITSTDPQSIPFRADWALFLDIDGTILEIAERPELVVVPDSLQDLLNDLGGALGGAAALLSGRTLSSIDELFPCGKLAVAGVHGMETRSSDGAISKTPPADGLVDVRDSLNAFIANIPGLIVEDKELSIAVHFRARPDIESQLRERIAELIGGLDELIAMDGKMVIEIKPKYRDKGSAIREFMATPPFLERTPLFFGDDKTDEFGFAAVNELGGLGVRVGGRGETKADGSLESVAATHAWLVGFREYLAEDTL